MNIRPKSCTPPTVASNDAVLGIVDDVVHGWQGPLREPVHMFLDCVGFVSHFHESADGLDTFDHSGNAGCNVCCFLNVRGNTFQTLKFSANCCSA